VTAKNCPSCHRPLPSDAPGGLCPACVLLGASGEIDPPGVPSLEEIQAAFPQFEILEYIGRGGMGVVYKVLQPQLDRLLALKILLPGLDHDPGFAERFSREARALAKLGHPNIVAVHDFGETGGFFWLTMEYVDGVNLRQAMQAARFTPAQALALIPDLCAALQYAHDHGILHRDIKPENILLDTRGRVKIADFGIARIAGDDRGEFTLTKTGSVLGSAAYIAPEQIERPQDVDHRADLYSLGVVFYEMLTGELPLGRFPAPSEKSTSDPRLDEVVFRTLEKEREKRYQSADALRAGVETAHSSPPPRINVPTPEKTNLTSKTFSWSSGLLGGGLIASAVGYFTSPTILGLGVIAYIMGTLGCWSLLIGMKSGRFATAHRKLLLAIAFVPVLLGMLWMMCIKPLLHFTDVVYSRQPAPLLWIVLPFIASVGIGILLWKLVALPSEGNCSPRFRKSTKWRGLAGISILLLALLTAKHLSVNLNVLNSYHEQTFSFRKARTSSLNDEDAALVKKAATEAAGEHAGFYQIEFPKTFRKSDPPGSADESNTMGFTVVTNTLWSEKRAKAHIASFEQRLRSLLPLRIRMEVGSGRLHVYQIEALQKRYHRIALVALPGLLATAALLIIFTSRQIIFASFAVGMVATFIFSIIDVWPLPKMLPPSLNGRPPLPLLTQPSEPPDPTGAVTAIQRFLDAAKAGDLATMKLGVSEELLVNLDRENRWEEVLTRIGGDIGEVKTLNGKAVGSILGTYPEPLRTVIYWMGKRSGGPITMVFEDGEWRLEKLPLL
jgi:hypothetical protein